MMEGWKVGRMIFRKSISANIYQFSLSYLTPLNETLLVGRFKRFCHIPCFQTLPPRRAPQARGEACVTVFERRSHLGPPAEGRLGPSDDDDDDDGVELSSLN